MRIVKSSTAALAFAVIAASLGACDFFEQPERAFTGDPQIEFSPLDETIDEPADSVGTATVTTRIQLIGPQRDTALPVSFAVDDSSTAVEGTHYTLGSTSASIPANASATEVTIEVLDNDDDDGDTNHLLFLTLQDSDGVEAAENLKTFILTIRGTDEE